MSPARVLLALAAVAAPLPALAHGFGRLYTLPVPLWLYGWGASAVLVVSFVIAGLFLTAVPQDSRGGGSGLDLRGTAFHRVLHALRPALQVLAVFLLLLTVATAAFGYRDPTRNFSMTFFWIIFLLLVTYLVAFLGNFYDAVNPWRALSDAIGRVWRGYATGWFRYDAARFGDWPAVALYLGFIWFELFGLGRPRELAVFLGGYTLLNLAGVGLIGARDWFRHCEFFAVFLRLIGLMAPIDYDRDARRFRLRWPFSGLVHARAPHVSTVVFALAMLSTTAFDGLKVTEWWVGLVWADPTGRITEWLGGRAPINAIADVMPWYRAWETAWLLVSPFVYLGAFLLTVWLGKFLARSERPVRDLALAFGLTLLPIALVYNITHYATLILTHGPKIISLLSDPFGWRWDLFGTAHKFRAPFLPEMGTVWHAQVGLILLGHVASVWIAHLVALREFPTRAKAALSQVPMLLLMVAFTLVGLWILASPLTQVRVV